MKNSTINRTACALLFGACLLAEGTAWSAPLQVNLYAKVVYINPVTGSASGTSSSSGRIPMWGFATSPGGTAAVPGTQINVTQTQFGDGLEITLFNQLPEPISLVIPGLTSSTVDGGQALGAPEAFSGGEYAGRVSSLVPSVPPGGSRVYRWTNLKPGTYVYHSGTHPQVQVQMGLFGMVTIKQVNNQAYPRVYISTGGEVPVIFSEIDTNLHWAVHTGNYGPGKSISSTIHSEPNFFCINGRAYNPNGTTPLLTPAMKNSWTTLFRLINVGWNSHIPVLSGPFPSGGENYLKVIAEDGEPYRYPKTLYAPNLAAMKTMDVQYTPPAGPNSLAFQVYDRKLGLANGGGMFRKLGNTTVLAPQLQCVQPEITTQPNSTNVDHGTTVQFKVVVNSTASVLAYQWRRNGVELTNVPSLIGGATGPTLTMAAAGVTSAIAGDYDVVIYGGCGEVVVSEKATLGVRPRYYAATTGAYSGSGTLTAQSGNITIAGSGVAYVNSMLVAAITYRSVGNPLVFAQSVTTISGGQAFTKLEGGEYFTADGKVELWYLTGPITGPAVDAVGVTFAGPPPDIFGPPAPAPIVNQVAIVVDRFAGVNQSEPFGDVTADYTLGDRPSVSVDAASDSADLVLGWVGYNRLTSSGGVIAITDGAGQTLRGSRQNNLYIPASPDPRSSASTRVTVKPAATVPGPAGTTTMSVGFAPDTAASMGAVAIKP